MNLYSCAITGHRPKSFPWGYDENAHDCILLKEVLSAQIAALADSGITDWLSGMALGVDLWAAEIVLGFREKNPALKLHCVLPYAGQADRWGDSARERYSAILKQADSVDCVSRQYDNGCLMDRNHRLVESAGLLLAVYNGTRRSGTGATVNYARRRGRRLIVIDPLTRSVTYEEGGA